MLSNNNGIEGSFKSRVRNTHIERIRPVISPALLLEQLPLSAGGEELIVNTRNAISRVIAGLDDRLIIVVGPCSVHDTKAAVNYAARLRDEMHKHEDCLCILMRTYFEKPRTVIGWKGLINDPYLDGSFQINEGLRAARQLLLDIVRIGVPTATEFLDLITPQYLADLVAWGAIGARTSECQTHRELASGLSMPVGFKNGTRGSVQIAIDAILAASHQHHFLSVTEQGITGFVSTLGNKDCHVVLRGSNRGPNCSREAIGHVYKSLERVGLRRCVMVDCSHDNSGKDHERQQLVVQDVAAQIAGGDLGIIGVMCESFIVPGAQKLKDSVPLAYGQSITDACMGWDTTVSVLEELAAAVIARRLMRMCS